MSSAWEVRGSAAVRWWPSRLMVTSCRPRSSRTILAMLIPVVSWKVAGYGQGGHHHSQVSLDGIALVVEDRAGPQVVLAHPKGLLDVPQLVIREDDLTSVHQMRGDVGDVALEAHQGPGSGDGGLIKDLIALMDGDKTRALRALLAGDDSPGAVGLSCEGLVVPGRSLLGVGPHRSP